MDRVRIYRNSIGDVVVTVNERDHKASDIFKYADNNPKDPNDYILMYDTYNEFLDQERMFTTFGGYGIRIDNNDENERRGLIELGEEFRKEAEEKNKELEKIEIERKIKERLRIEEIKKKRKIKKIKKEV